MSLRTLCTTRRLLTDITTGIVFTVDVDDVSGAIIAIVLDNPQGKTVAIELANDNTGVTFQRVITTTSIRVVIPVAQRVFAWQPGATRWAPNMRASCEVRG